MVVYSSVLQIKMAERNLDVKTRWIKYTLLYVSILLVLSSAIIITLGTSVFSLHQSLVFFLYNNYLQEALSPIIIGVVILLVAIFGFVGALRESTFMVNWFAVMLSVLLMVEVYAAIDAFSMWYDASWVLSDNMKSFLPNYHSNLKHQHAFDLMQSRLHCCGLESYMDWDKVSHPGDDSSNGFIYDKYILPRSCCEVITRNFYNKEECSIQNFNGCRSTVNNLSYQLAIQLGAVALVVAVIQVIGIIVSSFSLVRSVRRFLRGRSNSELNEKLVNHYTPVDSGAEKKEPFTFRLIAVGPFSLVFTKDLV